MPKVSLGKKIIISNLQTDTVFQAYREAFDRYETTGEALAPDEKEVKANLQLEEKKEAVGYFAKFLRLTTLSNAATYQLEPLTLELDQWCNEFFRQLNSSVLQQLAVAIYGDDSPQCILECSHLNSAAEMDNHYIFICELIQRIVAVALAENLIKQRKHQTLEHDDTVVLMLKSFINNLMIDPLRTKTLFAVEGGKKVSILSSFLNDELIDTGAAVINALIYNAQEVNAPSKNFGLLSDNLDRIQISLRGYLLVYMSSINKQLYPREQPLLLTNENLDPSRLLSIFPYIVDALSQQASTHETNENKEELVVYNGALIADNYISIIKMFNDSLVKITDTTKLDRMRYAVSQIEQLFIYDEQLGAIKEAVNEFVFFCKAGGWIPIMLSVIRPDILSKIIERFKLDCQHAVKDCFKTLNDSTNFGVGLLCLPRFEWSRLQTINLAINNLTSPAILARITEKFNEHINKMQIAERKLKQYRLMDNDQHIISMTQLSRNTSNSSRIMRDNSSGNLIEEEMRVAATPSHKVRSTFDVQTPNNQSRMFTRAGTEPTVNGSPLQSGRYYATTPSPSNRSLHGTPTQNGNRYLQPPGATPYSAPQRSLHNTPSAGNRMFSEPHPLPLAQQPSQLSLAPAVALPMPATNSRTTRDKRSCCVIS